jgi:hypothetical protein
MARLALFAVGVGLCACHTNAPTTGDSGVEYDAVYSSNVGIVGQSTTCSGSTNSSLVYPAGSGLLAIKVATDAPHAGDTVAQLQLQVGTSCGASCTLPTTFVGHLDVGHVLATSDPFDFPFQGWRGDDCTMTFAAELALDDIDATDPGRISGTLTLGAGNAVDHTVGGDGCSPTSGVTDSPCGGVQSVAATP